jgi:hypothetical protein
MQDETTQKDKNTSALYKPKSSHEAVFMSMSKKAEKISTAIYMVTDLIEVGDPIRHRLRECGVELIRETRQMSFAFSGDIYFQVGRAISKSWEIISLIDVASSVGFISDMNARILRGVLIELVGSLRDKQKRESFSKIEDLKIGESLAGEITLTKELFEIKEEKESFQIESTPMSFKGQNIKDKETSFTKPASVQSTPLPKPSAPPKPKSLKPENGAKKSERTEKITALVKEKGEVMIGDIVGHFPDVSSKTIQRELASLVESGTLRKEGEKRWSRYYLQQ